jgi:hypothetical protein
MTKKPNQKMTLDESTSSRDKDVHPDNYVQDCIEKGITQFSIIKGLPKTISRCVRLMDTPDEKMMATYSAITVAGALMPKVWFNYDNKRTHLQVMVVIVYPPASGKGKVALFNLLLKRINQEQRESNNKLLRVYNLKMKDFQKALKNGGFPDPPEKPSLKLLTIPGNISSAKLVEQLAENNGNMAILTIETEIDAFTNMFTSPFGGDNAMMLRKIFHNENISVMRKTNSEHLEAENPKMALLLTGTPIQISSLFKNNKDGLNSRFIVLSGAGSSDWKDVQPAESSVPLDEQFERIGNTFYAIYHHFKELEIEIKFSEEQWAALNMLGTAWLERCITVNEDFAGIAKRHVNMIVRVASTLTVIRFFEQKQTKDVIHCADIDFKTAVGLLKYSFESALDVFTKLPDEAVPKDRSDEFFNLIPESFKRKEIAPLKNTLGVSDKWIDRILVKLVNHGRLLKLSHGKYEKVALSVLS